MNLNVFYKVLETVGHQPQRLLGIGAEGLVFFLRSGRVAKFWESDPDGSYPLWRWAFKNRISGFPEIYSFDSVIVPTRGRYHLMIRENLNPVTTKIEQEPYLAFLSGYQPLMGVLESINRKLPPDSLSSPMFSEFTAQLVQISRKFFNRGYEEFYPEIGLTDKGRLAILDLL